VAIRGDITVDWTLSPRIITVLAPSAEITMQDLLDTLRSLEAESTAMDDHYLVDAAGKEDLGGGVLVGLTVTLQNAKLAFEARGGPTFILCRVSGGNLVAVDENDVTFLSPISPTAYVQVVLANSSSATLIDADVKAALVEALTVDTYGESTAPPAATASIVAKVSWLVTLALNKILQTGTQQKVRNTNDNADVAIATVSDDGETFTRGKWQ